MKKLILIFAGVALFVAPAVGQPSAFRLYLAEEGVDLNTPLGGISPAQVNPNIVDPGGGTHRLYVWGQVIGAETPQKYLSVGYNVRTTGSLVITGASTWNYSNILTRWSATNGGLLTGGALQDVRLVANPVGFFGVAERSFAGFDDQYDPATKSTVIGWIEVTGIGDVFLQVGDVGIIRTNSLGNPGATWDDVYLGFGDEGAGVMGNSFDVGSPIPEATIELGGPPALSITTLFANNNSGSPGGGVYFDMTTGASPIEIIGFDVNSSAIAGTVMAFEVYTHAGGHAGFQNSNAGWILEATGVGSTTSPGLPSAVSLASPFEVPANSVIGMALTLGSAVGHAYTNGNGANQHYENADLALDLGSSNNVIFGAGLFSPRVWNGTIYYNIVPCYPDCDQSTGFRVLDMFDFLCFQDSFVNGEPYACDCDTSTGNGVCDVFDFLCFLDEFFAGCS